MKTSLVLEGGGMRGLYTAGVLDFFLDEKIDFAACIGVSAGACIACSFLSKQRFRAAAVNIDYMSDKRCFSFKNLIKDGSIFDYDFIFNTVANQLYPFDFETFAARTTDFYAVSTDINTAKPVYKRIDDINKDDMYIKASMALPMLSYPLEADGLQMLDGGISDSIPVEFALSLPNDKTVVILTQHRSYQKGKSRLQPLIKRKYKRYPKLVETLENRHIAYNATLKKLYELEKEGKIFLIQPKDPITISRLEKDPVKLKALYDLGYWEAKRIYPKLKAYLEK